MRWLAGGNDLVSRSVRRERRIKAAAQRKKNMSMKRMSVADLVPIRPITDKLKSDSSDVCSQALCASKSGPGNRGKSKENNSFNANKSESNLLTTDDSDEEGEHYPKRSRMNISKIDALARSLSKCPHRLDEAELCFGVATKIFFLTSILSSPLFIIIFLRLQGIAYLSAMTYQFTGIFLAHAAHISIVVYSFYDPEMSQELKNMFQNMRTKQNPEDKQKKDDESSSQKSNFRSKRSRRK